MELSAGGCYLPVACRFVPNDQWLVTHLNPSWKISQVKQWLLAKYFPALFALAPDWNRPSQKKRAVSPITFARRVEAEEGDSLQTDEYNDPYDSDSDEALLDTTDKYKYVPPRSLAPPTPSDEIPKTTPSATLPQYTLLSFSTGQILEDHYELSWYAVYPHELFELHSHTSLVKLPRDNIADYVKPYFEARVWALKVLTKDDEGNLGIPRSGEKIGWGPDSTEYDREKLLKKRRTKFQWQERWVIIHRGVFQLCKDRNDRSPTHVSQLSSLVSLRGAEHVQYLHAGPSAHSSLAFVSPPSSHNSPPLPEGSPTGTDQRIICAKFRKSHRHGEGPGPWWRRGSRDRDRDAGGSEESRKNSGSGAEPTSAEEDCDIEEDRHDDSVVIVMKMLDDASYNNMLRILHRYEPLHSSFIPISSGHGAHSPRRRSFSPISFASASPGGSPSISPERYPPLAPRSTSPYFNPSQRSVRYPEWRHELVRKARRAGLGDVGKAMEIIMFGHKLVEEDDRDPLMDIDQSPKDSHPEGSRGRSTAWGVELDNSSEDESGEESSSEREWEGWEADLLSRRARRDIPGESEVTWASSWSNQYGGGGFKNVSPSYTFPGSGSGQVDSRAPGAEKDWAAVSRRRTLSSYSSADSLLKRTIKRASPRKRHPGRSGSPSRGFRTRPRSPLAEHSDFDDDSDHTVPWQSMLVHSPPPHLTSPPTHPSRQSSFESSSSHASRITGISQSSTMSRLPMTMAMTSIATFTEKEKDKEKQKDKKGKGKDMSGAVFAPRPTRKRSSTVQSPSSRSLWSATESNSSIAGAGSKAARQRPQTANVVAPTPQRTASERSGVEVKGRSDKDSEEGKEKPEKKKEKAEGKSGRLKLSMSFAQVAAMGTVTAASGRLPPLSTTSTSSFESPRFAHPEESE
ncbi:hypothetical protein BDY19DRAFT_1004250 [Irpex rosettiformis]|uniref:Uncharacterized protein n=1 Tax=Irpex rosettiformis TaxID=378272 RepID=A0ACB8U5A4_9APHY|nr:hypothetical protein BDY19DRAFT_1004250 [Irpex rosettiformis]